MLKNVLLIDDDQDDVNTFADALHTVSADIGFEHIPDGISAISRLRQNDQKIPDIIFLDINMPMLNGWDCLRELKKTAQVSNIPIIMYSTSPIHNKGLTPADVGAAAFMTKPDSFPVLVANLENMLNQLF